MKSAFTLIEQLAALALSTLLMGAVLIVLAGAARATRASGGRDASPRAASSSPGAAMVAPHATAVDDVDPAAALAADLIRDDLLESRHVLIGDNQFTLTGLCSLDASTLQRRHRPVRVSYTLVHSGSASQLRRRQEPLDVPGNQGDWSDIVCHNVQSIALVAAVAAPSIGLTQPRRGQQRVAAPAPVDPFSPADGPETLGAYRLVLRGDDASAPRVDRILTIR